MANAQQVLSAQLKFIARAYRFKKLLAYMTRSFGTPSSVWIGKRAMPRVFRNYASNSTPFHPTSQILTYSSTVEEGAPWTGAWLAIMRDYAKEENEIEDDEWIDYHLVWFQDTLEDLGANASNYIQREARLRVEAYGEELVQSYEFYDNLVDRLRWVYGACH
ncbi:hypothetical protein BJ165DRAFT_1591167 [Panaeolus papilionaceus]|nr:hypothetical protein BJ165DRAFT_1591167 [Panaeolus papilionaceus]